MNGKEATMASVSEATEIRTHGDLRAALIARGWTVDDDGDLTRDNGIVMLHSDGASVAVSDRDIYPTAVVVTPAQAFLWATDPASVDLTRAPRVSVE